MTPSPDLISAVLALPLEARRLLAQQEGPGWWCRTNEENDRIWFYVQDRPDDQARGLNAVPPDEMLAREWAWLPANDTAWMRAATPEGGEWQRWPPTARDTHTFGIWTDDGDSLASAPTAPECAIAALRARFGP